MDASASPIAIRQEIARLRREAEALSSPATFAESAKRARAARALERRLEAQEAAQDGVRRARRGALFKVKWLALILAVALAWGRPALRLDFAMGVSLWPLDALLRFPDCQGMGSATIVSTLAMCLICDRVLFHVAPQALGIIP